MKARHRSATRNCAEKIFAHANRREVVEEAVMRVGCKLKPLPDLTSVDRIVHVHKILPPPSRAHARGATPKIVVTRSRAAGTLTYIVL